MIKDIFKDGMAQAGIYGLNIKSFGLWNYCKLTLKTILVIVSFPAFLFFGGIGLICQWFYTEWNNFKNSVAKDFMTIGLLRMFYKK